jgi:hypothetical protein
MSTSKWFIILALALFVFSPLASFANTTGDTGQTGTETGVTGPDQDDPGADPVGEGPADPEGEEPGEQPTYSNAAQAMHAANLAETAALKPDAETEKAADGLASARESYHDAKEALAAAPDDPDLQEAVKRAEEDLSGARESYADAIAERAGVLGEDIQEMRQNRMGWGQIASELGVHPGVLGLGHTKRNRGLDPVEGLEDVAYSPDRELDPQAEIAEATRRDKQYGWSKAHGLGTGDAKGSKKGLGLSKTSAGETGSHSLGNKAGKSTGGGSSKSAGTSQSNSGRGAHGGPAGSSSNSGGKGKDKDKSNKSNNGKGEGNHK